MDAQTLVDEIVEHFESRGFICVNMSLGLQVFGRSVLRAIEAQRRTSDVAAVLHHFPEVFVFPKHIEPEKGCLLGVLDCSDRPLTASRIRILEAFMPSDRIAVFSADRDKEIHARWYHAKRSKAISDFISAIK